MPQEVYNILIICTPKSKIKLVSRLLQPECFKIHWEDRQDAGLRLVVEGKYDALLVELDPRQDGSLQILKKFLSAAFKLPIIAIGNVEESSNIEDFFHSGAQDYLLIPKLSEKQLLVSIQNATARKEHEFKLRESYYSAVNFTNDSEVKKRRQAEDTLRKLSLAVEQSPASVVIIDLKGVIEYINPKFMAVTGYEKNEILGKNWFAMRQENLSHKQFEAMMFALTVGQQWRGEILNKRKDGNPFWEFAVVSPIISDDGSIANYLAVTEDITIRKEYEEKLLHQATYDTLTKLPNRLLMLDRMKQMIARVRREKIRSAVLFIDLDRFKDVNDTFGHEFGDKLLIIVSERLRQCVRESDTVSRLGGDEFLVILVNTIEEIDASIVAQRILDALVQPVIVEGQEIFISASIGITICPNDGIDPQTLLRNADAAMYQSKDISRNTYRFFTEELNLRAQRRMQLNSRLRHAIQGNHLFLVYQPILDVQTKRIIGAEALVRWNDPELGLVMPDQFIPVAEESNMIIAIGKWVFHEAIQQAKIWQKTMFADFRMTINVSVRQFQDPQFSRQIEEAIKQYQINPLTIELEVTEDFMLNKTPVIFSNLEHLKALGLRLAIDDFGAGYSSLSYFTRFSFSTLKIDRRFMNDIPYDTVKSELYKAIINVGKSLDLNVVSEGVETIQHFEFIKNNNCDLCQGFLFSKPLSVKEFETFSREFK